MTCNTEGRSAAIPGAWPVARASRALAALALLCVTAAGPAMAQGAIVREAGWNHYLASELTGVPVRDENDSEIGEVSDLLLRSGTRVTGLILSLDDADQREVVVSYADVLIGAPNRTYGGRGAGQAGAARDPRSLGWEQDPQAFADPRRTYGRIQPSHVLLPGLSEAEVDRAPDWPFGAWRDNPERERAEPENRQMTFDSLRGLPVIGADGRRVGTSDDLLIDRDGSMEALLVLAQGRLVALDMGAIAFEEARRPAPGVLAAPARIHVRDMTQAQIERAPEFRLQSER